MRKKLEQKLIREISFSSGKLILLPNVYRTDLEQNKPSFDAESIVDIKSKTYIVKGYNDEDIDEDGYDYNIDCIDRIPKFMKVTTKDSETHIFYKPKHISQGSEGRIYMYRDKYDRKLVLKSGNISEDVAIIRRLKKKKIDRNFYVPCYVHDVYRPIFPDKLKYSKYIVMEYVPDDLNSLAKHFKDNNLICRITVWEVIERITCMFMYLADMKLFYTDIKPENILFKYISGNCIKILLADLGSIVTKHGMSNTTYPPLDRSDPEFPNAKESDIVWGIGILILKLLNLDDIMDDFHWAEIENLMKDVKHNQRSKILKVHIKSKLEAVEKSKVVSENNYSTNIPVVLKKIFEINPKKRVKLYELLIISRTLIQYHNKNLSSGLFDPSASSTKPLK